MAELKEFFEVMETKVLLDPEGLKQADWAKNLQPCSSGFDFRDEAVWVIFCSGISYRAARAMQKLYKDEGICKHPHKAAAIEKWMSNGLDWFGEYIGKGTEDARMEYLRSLPYMGGEALVYQLAKNLGITGYCKPDVHLKRLAEHWGADTPQALCESIAEMTGNTVAYIDTILWFSAMRRWAYEHI